MSSGRLKVFRNCVNWQSEYRIYRRDEKGKVVKENDHGMDDTRYLIMTGMQHACLPPEDVGDAGERMAGAVALATVTHGRAIAAARWIRGIEDGRS